MRKINRLIVGALVLYSNVFLLAQGGSTPGGPPVPTNPGGGGGGSTPGGAPATPIDMYQVYLLIVGVLLIGYFAWKIMKANKLKLQNSKN